MATMVMGCSKKNDVKEVLDFKEAVYGYMHSSQSMAGFIAGNIDKYKSGMHYFDIYNGSANYSHGEYCEDVSDMVTVIRNHYREQKSINVIQSYKEEAKRLLPKGKTDLSQLYRLAEDMEELAVTSSLTSTYSDKYNLLIEHFTVIFSATDMTYPNTAVNYKNVQDGITKLQETLMDLESE